MGPFDIMHTVIKVHSLRGGGGGGGLVDFCLGYTPMPKYAPKIGIFNFSPKVIIMVLNRKLLVS